MNKVCPMLLVAARREDVMVAEGLAKGDYMCIGPLCAAYRVALIPILRVPSMKTELEHTEYCGMAGNGEHAGNIDQKKQQTDREDSVREALSDEAGD